MSKKLGWLGERFCLLCAGLFSCVILLQTVITGLGGGKYALFFGAGLFAAGVLPVLAYRKLTPGRTFLVLVFGLRLVLALAVILPFRTQPVQDFQTMYNAACQVASGSREYLSDPYFYNWAYQTGFVAYEALVIKVFGPGLLPLQLMNALWMSGIGCLVYEIGRKFLSEQAAMAAALFYALYPGPYFLAGVLTNQHIALFFYALGIWLLVRRDRLSLSGALPAGLSIALGNVMRPLGALVVMAFLCWGLVRLLLWKGPGRWKEAGLLAGAAAVYFACTGLFSWLVAVSGLNPEGLANNLPLWKFVVGLHPAGGLWTRQDYENYYLLPAAQAEEAMGRAIRERLGAGPVSLARLAWMKSATMWGAPESLFWGFGDVQGTTLGKALTAVNYGDRGVFALAFGLALCALWRWLKKGTEGKAALLLAFLVCGYYAAHLVVEVQPRYRYFLMPFLFLLAGAGLEWVLEKFSGLFRPKLPEKENRA